MHAERTQNGIVVDNQSVESHLIKTIIRPTNQRAFRKTNLSLEWHIKCRVFSTQVHLNSMLFQTNRALIGISQADEL